MMAARQQQRNSQQRGKRSPNFTIQEKRALYKIICTKYQNILEDKKLDRSTTQRKLTIWKTIENEFNAQSPSLIFRHWKCLKTFYDNQKKEAKKLRLKRRLEPSSIKVEKVIVEEEQSDGKLTKLEEIMIIEEMNPDDLQPEEHTPEESDGLSSERLNNINTSDETPPIGSMKILNSSPDLSQKYELLLDKRMILVEKQIEEIETTLAFKKRKFELELDLMKLEVQKKKMEMSREMFK